VSACSSGVRDSVTVANTRSIQTKQGTRLLNSEPIQLATARTWILALRRSAQREARGVETGPRETVESSICSRTCHIGIKGKNGVRGGAYMEMVGDEILATRFGAKCSFTFLLVSGRTLFSFLSSGLYLRHRLLRVLRSPAILGCVQ
jgi:hypothetical protein